MWRKEEKNHTHATRFATSLQSGPMSLHRMVDGCRGCLETATVSPYRWWVVGRWQTAKQAALRPMSAHHTPLFKRSKTATSVLAFETPLFRLHASYIESMGREGGIAQDMRRRSRIYSESACSLTTPSELQSLLFQTHWLTDVFLASLIFSFLSDDLERKNLLPISEKYSSSTTARHPHSHSILSLSPEFPALPRPTQRSTPTSTNCHQTSIKNIMFNH